MARAIFNEHAMDNALNALGKKFTPKERRYINRQGISPFAKALKDNVKSGDKGTSKFLRPSYIAKYGESEAQKHKDRNDLSSAIDTNYTPTNGVEVGFTKKSKKAYIGRLLNDGWDVRNKRGGPWTHVEGEHYWENTQNQADKAVKKAEAEALKRVMENRMNIK